MHESTTRHLHANLQHGIEEELAILSFMNRWNLRTNEFDVILGKNPLFMQRYRCIQCNLATHGWKDCFRSFLADDLFNKLWRDRLNVGGIRNVRIRHDCCRIGVNQNDTIPLFTQHLTRLRPRVVKLARLSNNNWTGSDDKNCAKVSAFWHSSQSESRMKKSLQDGHPHSYAVCDLTVNKTGRMIKDLGIKFDTNVHRSWMEDR